MRKIIPTLGLVALLTSPVANALEHFRDKPLPLLDEDRSYGLSTADPFARLVELEYDKLSANPAHADLVLSIQRRYGQIITSTSERYDVPESLVYALIITESSGINNVVSHKGAAGLMGIMPDTARSLGLIVTDEKDERYDPKKAIPAGIKELIRCGYGVEEDFIPLSKYNAGSARINKLIREYGTNWEDLELQLPEQTKVYPVRILAWELLVDEVIN